MLYQGNHRSPPNVPHTHACPLHVKGTVAGICYITVYQGNHRSPPNVPHTHVRPLHVNGTVAGICYIRGITEARPMCHILMYALYMLTVLSGVCYIRGIMEAGPLNGFNFLVNLLRQSCINVPHTHACPLHVNGTLAGTCYIRRIM